MQWENHFMNSNADPNETIYDTHVAFYLDFVQQALANQDSLWNMLLARFEAVLGNRLHGARIVDVACGEGYLSRFLAARGPQEVVGVDISKALIAVATERRNAPNLSYHIDDAQHLATLADASFDIAVSQMAIMDIPDHRALFQSVRRVLKRNGVFVFTLLHPCFETPFRAPEQPQFLLDLNGMPTATLVHRYASEGFWQSGGTGVRGRVGAHHRTLSTLVNDLIAAGFLLEKLEEPVEGDSGLHAEVPRILLVAARVQ